MEKNIITGSILFDGVKRQGFQFDVIELQNTGRLLKIGFWDNRNGLIMQRPATLTTTTVEHDPEPGVASIFNETLRILIAVPVRTHQIMANSWN